MQTFAPPISHDLTDQYLFQFVLTKGAFSVVWYGPFFGNQGIVIGQKFLVI